MICFLCCLYPSKDLLWSPLKAIGLPLWVYRTRRPYLNHVLWCILLMVWSICFHPNPFVMPQLKLNLVLTLLMGTTLEQMHSYPLRLLALKTDFLTITSARCMSVLEAWFVYPLCTTFFTEKLVLRTRESFLPIVVTPFHVGQSITLLAFFLHRTPRKRRNFSTSWTPKEL